MNIYRVKMNDEEFFKCSNKIVACNISVSNGQVFFKTDKITIKYLKDNDLKYELLDGINAKVKRNILINRGIIFGILIFAFLLFMNSYRVSAITYNASYAINDEITEEINKDMKKLLFWDFYGGSLDKCAASLRRKYVNYQWISLDKEGSKIKVIINDFDESAIKSNELVIGDIVAAKEGIIKYYTIYRGGNNVEVNKYVKKGDVLISSDLLINKGLDKKDLTEARGLVIANTYETVEQKVLKQETTTILTGMLNSYTRISIFGLNINLGKKNAYTNYVEKENTKFNLFNAFTVKKIEENEKCDIIKTYNQEEAIELVKTMIENDFMNSITSDLEKIDRMETISIVEEKNAFVIKMLVKKQESIGVFQPLGE